MTDTREAFEALFSHLDLRTTIEGDYKDVWTEYCFNGYQACEAHYKERIAELEKDAEKYRFLRGKVFYDENGVYLSSGRWNILDKHKKTIKTDEAIDQALADSKE